ncbi:hypothetical protein [Saccharopolyspora sp. ASAGF58]|uniref:hypothetical protein n=1 Tax=Saccharopolyspora sp. ASAGF58 TaxID=2719023 RepID=UPI001B309249
MQQVPTRTTGIRSRSSQAWSPASIRRCQHKDRLVDALHQQAFCALRTSPGARAYCDELRDCGMNHHAALRQLSNRLVGILHGDPGG